MELLLEGVGGGDGEREECVRRLGERWERVEGERVAGGRSEEGGGDEGEGGRREGGDVEADGWFGSGGGFGGGCNGHSGEGLSWRLGRLAENCSRRDFDFFGRTMEGVIRLRTYRRGSSTLGAAVIWGGWIGRWWAAAMWAMGGSWW